MKLLKKCDNLWRDILLKKAGYKSEISGELGMQVGGDKVLQVHHIARKPCYELRFDLENGIVMTMGEHKFGIHGEREEEYRKKIKEKRGEDIYDRLLEKKNKLSKKKIQEYYEELEGVWKAL